MIRVLHPGFAPGPYCAALSTKDCADYLFAENHVDSERALAIIFQGLWLCFTRGRFSQSTAAAQMQHQVNNICGHRHEI